MIGLFSKDKPNFNNLESFTKDKPKRLESNRIDRIKRILQFYHSDGNNDISSLLLNLKEKITERLEKRETLREERPLSILEDKLEESFYDSYLSNSFFMYEDDVPIIDRQNETLFQIHSVDKVAYIDTPITLDIDFSCEERPHWKELNNLLNKKSNRKKQLSGEFNEFNNTFKKDIIKGEINQEEQEFSSEPTLKYVRNDGKEFDLLECATGLKSFSILQLLYKNSFLNDKTLLIIDEPEAHLHPQWIVEYARLIVLLNKSLGIRFLIASHNPDMISAIKYISEKENIDDGVHFYLANQISGSFNYEYKDLKTDIEKIFASFNVALDKIDLYGSKEEDGKCGE